MMPRQSPLPLPRALKMPLRDILRGVTTVADVTEEMLEPATTLLPTFVQTSFRSALATVENAGNRAVTPAVDLADIAQASAFLKGADSSRQVTETFVNVIAYVWERTLARQADHHLLFSETIAAASLVIRRPGETTSPFTHAAAILTRLRGANAASRLPGTPMSSSAHDQAYIDRSLLSACVWLLSERGTTLAEEERLLELAFALVQALESDIHLDEADEDLLARQMQSLAEHL